MVVQSTLILFGSFFAMLLIGVPIFAMIMTILDDFIKARLVKKGEPTALRKYYPAHSFIKPHDEDKEPKTLTQRFIGWVASVETEVKGVDYKPSIRHSIGRGIRRFFLAIGLFFQRLFSVKPIPEDQANSAFRDIADHGMPTNRTFWRTFFLSIITLLLYPFHLVERMAQTINIACYKDGKRTWGLLPFLLFSVITLGIFPLIWNCKIITRMQTYCKDHGVDCVVTKKFYVLWTVPGFLTIVGPFIAIARLLRGYTQMCVLYNSLHTFPLSPEEIEAEEHQLAEAAAARKGHTHHRRALMDDILLLPHQPVTEADGISEDDALSADEQSELSNRFTMDIDTVSVSDSEKTE